MTFPSPCGVWVVSLDEATAQEPVVSFRPLAGCGLFPASASGSLPQKVSVPLRGVGCFLNAVTS